MNAKIKEKWLTALRSGKYKPVGHALKCADMHCSIGILCQIHMDEFGGKWENNMYCGSYISAPDVVLEWADLSKSHESQIIIANNEYTVDSGRDYSHVINYIEKYL